MGKNHRKTIKLEGKKNQTNSSAIPAMKFHLKHPYTNG